MKSSPLTLKKNWLNRVRNTRALALALVVHIGLFALIGFQMNWSKPVKAGAPQVIQATAINEADIQKATEALRQEELAQQRLEEEKQAEAQRELEELEKKKQEEEKQIQEREKQRQEEEKKKVEAEQARREEEKRVAAAQEKKRVEQRRLEEERQREVEAEKRKKLEAEKRRKEEEARKKKEAEEKKKREAAEKKRLEEERKKKEAEKKKREEAARKQREADLRRQMEAEQARRTEQEAGQALGFATNAIRQAVQRNFSIQPNWVGMETVVRVKVQQNGMVLSTRIIKSSGDRFFDQEAERAVMKASPLPIPTEPRFYPYINEFDFLFSPAG